ncbi:MAG: hypothetical protein J2P37_31460, partial [Ktedonobacteraceae bacterium]|nr:hypothetical protein [Ktedonobacteraceae bacterium]
MPVPRLTEAIIQHYASSESFERGSAYYAQGRVASPILRGTTLSAEVEGSEAFPYLVRCTFAADGSIEASCTCPYDWGGWCKHLVAACLYLVHEPATIEERPPLERLLSDLDRDQLQLVLLKLAKRYPHLVETIENEVQLLRPALPEAAPQASTGAPAPTRRVTMDTKAVRRQVRHSIHSLDRMRSSEAYWYVGAVVNDIRRVLDQVWALMEQDQGRDALPLLEAVTGAYMEEWENLDDSDGEASGFFSDLGPAWTEALLSADLNRKERKAWADRLTKWQGELDQYGVDEVLDCAAAAARDGWDSPPLQRVLQGT